MLTFIPTLVVFLFSATVTTATLTDQQKKCVGANCTVSAITASGCPLSDTSDFSCICASSVFASNLTQCMTATCGLSSSDAQATLSQQCPNSPGATGGGSSGSNAPGSKSNSAGANGSRLLGATGIVVGLATYALFFV
ncbi:hypothetical protein B0H19DRAFT_1122901 [Mycena capillaripes]|nr:hypothetical protein B0H19DRAFT_1122901 [Mycena capillaripes]